MAVIAHAEAEIAAAWSALEQLYAEMPGNARVAGAGAAAEWTTGRIGMSPITNVVEPAVGERLVWEGPAADMVVMGRRPGDPAYAAGVLAWMAWWVGLEPLPRWLR